MVRAILLCLVLIAAAPAVAQTRTATPGQAPPSARVADLAWMAGSWEGEGFGQRVREVYSPPIGGQMAGHFIMMNGNAPGLYEFMMLAEVGGSIEYRVRHVNPDMTAWEERDRFVRFPLVAVEPGTWYFDGLTIRRIDADTVEHLVRIRGRDGQSRDERLVYRRARQ